MSTIDDYRAAQAAYETLRRRWNALPSSEARAASGISFTDVDAAVERAAAAVIREVGPRHRIEEWSKVYLTLGPAGTWEIDSGPDAGVAADGYDGGPGTGGCDHDEGLDDECAALAEAASTVSLPSAAELVVMLADQLGMTVTGPTRP